MKKLIHVVFLLVPLISWCNNFTKTYTIINNLDDYLLIFDANEKLQITTEKQHFFSERNEPALPLFPYEISLEGQYSYITSKVRFNQKLIKSNVIIQENPIPVITDAMAQVSESNGLSYSSGVFPIDNFVYSTQSRWSDLTIFHFLVSPFRYDATNKNLYFIESFSIDVTYTDDNIDSSKNSFGKISSQTKRIINQFSDNSINDHAKSVFINNNDSQDNIEYLIITTDSLIKSFEPLNNWKSTKGFKSKIISVEEIYSNFSGSTTSLKIKNCLYDLYLNKGLVYVLLGGDDTIVPVQGCYSQVGDYKDYSIPSDIFYSCFDGNFEWDGNQNGLYGEIEDNINFTQYIYITRVPVRTNNDVVSFVSKLLKYEQNPNWGNKMLMSGTKLWRYMKDSTQSDAEAKAENLYNNFIKPYWEGTRYRLFDTATDFIGNENYNLTKENLKTQLSTGYDFVDVITHGSQTSWSMETGGGYSSIYGMTQKNSRASIVTTMACHTNAFDMSDYPGKSDPCLSESLIRNPNSGVIAYLGSSRYGWGLAGNVTTGGSSNLGPSLQYEAQFYRYLFDRNFDLSNYGVVVSMAKSSLIASCAYNEAFHWLQLSLNPIGDPETPIFIEQPKLFSDIEIEHTTENISIKTGVDGCKICISSAQDYGNTYHKVYDLVDKYSINKFPPSHRLCVTKQGYIPLVYHALLNPKTKQWITQNDKLIGNNKIKLDNIVIGSEITDELPIGNVEVASGKTEIIAKSVFLRGGFSVSKGAEFKITNK